MYGGAHYSFGNSSRCSISLLISRRAAPHQFGVAIRAIRCSLRYLLQHMFIVVLQRRLWRHALQERGRSRSRPWRIKHGTFLCGFPRRLTRRHEPFLTDAAPHPLLHVIRVRPTTNKRVLSPGALAFGVLPTVWGTGVLADMECLSDIQSAPVPRSLVCRNLNAWHCGSGVWRGRRPRKRQS